MIASTHNCYFLQIVDTGLVKIENILMTNQICHNFLTRSVCCCLNAEIDSRMLKFQCTNVLAKHFDMKADKIVVTSFIHYKLNSDVVVASLFLGLDKNSITKTN